MNNDWFKNHIDTLVILSAFSGCILWMNGQFNDIDRQFSYLKNEISILKTVLIMKNSMTVELASSDKIKMNEV